MKKRIRKSLSIMLAGVLLVLSLLMVPSAFAAGTSFANAEAITAFGDAKTATVSTSSPAYYKVTLNQGDTINISLYSILSSNVDVSFDADVRLYDSSQTYLSSSLLRGTLNEYLSYKVSATGTYYIKIDAYTGSGTVKLKIARGDFLNSPNYNVSFSRTTARSAAIQYAPYPGTTSHGSTVFGANGGDCTNFVSQCLKAGGMPMVTGNRDSSAAWFFNGYSNTSQYSATWTGATQFSPYWGTNCSGSGNRKAYAMEIMTISEAYNKLHTLRNQLKPGDIIQFTNSTDNSYRKHSIIIHDITDSDILYSQHSLNSNSNIWCANNSLAQKLRSHSSDSTGGSFILIYRMHYSS